MNQTDGPEIERALRADIAGAVARGWCSPKNAAKVMDADLANAITAALLPLFNAGVEQARIEGILGIFCDEHRVAAGQALVEGHQADECPVCEMLSAVAGAYAAAYKACDDAFTVAFCDQKLGIEACLQAGLSAIRALTHADARQAQDEKLAWHGRKVGAEAIRFVEQGTGNQYSTLADALSAAIASAEARARLEEARSVGALIHKIVQSHKPTNQMVWAMRALDKRIAELEAAARTPTIETPQRAEALRDAQVAKSIVDEWREDETGRVYVHKDVILKAINATIQQLTFLLDHSYNVPKDWRKRLTAVLTPADARQASQQVERMACGHLKADWVETEDVCACGFGLHQHRNFTGNPKAPSQCANFRKVTAIEGHCRTCAAIASAEACAQLEAIENRDREWIEAMHAEDLEPRNPVNIENYVKWFEGNCTSGHVQDIERLELELIQSRNDAVNMCVAAVMLAHSRNVSNENWATRAINCIRAAEAAARTPDSTKEQG